MVAPEDDERAVSLVRELLTQPREFEWLEDKENNSNPELIGEYISALSNSAAIADVDKAYMIWGVRDSERTVVGTAFKPSQQKYGNEDLEHWLTRLLSPQIHFKFHELIIDGFTVVLMEVDRAIGQPVKFKNEEYVRVGSYKKKLRQYPGHARRLWSSFDRTTFEEGVTQERMSSSEVLQLLDYPSYFELMEVPLPEARAGVLEVLDSDGLIKQHGSERWDVTNLGAILFGRDLGRFTALKRKMVRIIQYRGTGRIETIKERVIIEGYASGFKEMISYISNLLPSNEVIGQALRQTVKMYPDLAVRELLANALIHQDFSMTGTGPMVEIFDDRLEITNPGTPLIDPLRFIDSPPISRNERLAGMMRRMGVCEERGSGWDKIAFQIEFHQLPAPLVEIVGTHTRVTMFAHKSLREMDRAERVRAVYLHACLKRVMHEKVTNTSVRERFGIEARNKAQASRLIKEALEDRMIVLKDPSAANRLREYVPWWAAPDLNPNGTSV